MTALYVPRVVEGQLTIDNLEFSQDLFDHHSPAFNELAKTVEDEIKRAVFDKQTLNYGPADLYVKVLDMKAGSIIVKYRIGWIVNEGIIKPPDPISTNSLIHRLQTHLRDHNGFVYNFKLPSHSLRAHRVEDMCEIDNYGCSHHCHFDYINLIFMCSCPDSYHLSADNKTCIIEENNSPVNKDDQTSTENPFLSSLATTLPSESGSMIDEEIKVKNISSQTNDELSNEEKLLIHKNYYFDYEDKTEKKKSINQNEDIHENDFNVHDKKISVDEMSKNNDHSDNSEDKSFTESNPVLHNIEEEVTTLKTIIPDVIEELNKTSNNFITTTVPSSESKEKLNTSDESKSNKLNEMEIMGTENSRDVAFTTEHFPDVDMTTMINENEDHKTDLSKINITENLENDAVKYNRNDHTIEKTKADEEMTELLTEINNNSTSDNTLFERISSLPFGFSKCASGQFQCTNGTTRDGSCCVPMSAKCDSVSDCSDGSDELNCVEEHCPGNFQCSNGDCLKRHLVCNNIVDCYDNSDEVNCENWHCLFDEFQCPSGRCIPSLWQCDGKADCDNHTDEYNCPSSCGNNEFMCPEGWCIPLTWRCNGVPECSNGEDEKLCDCSLDKFKCDTGGCVSKSAECDGEFDCPDGSDEWNCVKIDTTLQIRSEQNNWLPVCSNEWSKDWSDSVCTGLGFSKSHYAETQVAVPENLTDYFVLKSDAKPQIGGKITSSVIKTNDSMCSNLIELSCQKFTCGTQSTADGGVVMGRLVGGEEAADGQWRSVAIIYQTKTKGSCTASIITPRWLISSYNCLHSKDKTLSAEGWVVFGGGSIFETEKPETQTKDVLEMIPHPQAKYNRFHYDNDIVLVGLKEPLTFTQYVGAICLPEKEIEPRQICVTAGWGYTSPGEINFKQYLHYLPVPKISLDECNSSKHYSGFITDDEICAGYTDSSKTPCYNDEGAPLMCVTEGGIWELQGILSYHSNCGRGYHPSIFSSISAARKWIEKTVNSHFIRKSTFNV
ncbi:uncharacterized protein LOC142333391 [Lycorma delicatula]|uniref:uncharacterized protein LOC142333391 n=1 Tax=Lycorma delicatula TaxID=130591 RepID=UPI003F512D0C